MKILLFLALFPMAQFAFAQTPTNKLDFLYGRWEGVSNRAGVVRYSYECNYPKLDGKIGVIEAKFVEVESGVEHREVGIFSLVPNSEKYNFKLYKNNGSIVDAIGTMDSDNQIGTLELSVPNPTVGQPDILVRFKATITGKDWHETGERSLDSGKTWTSFYDMNLKKVADTCRDIDAATNDIELMGF